MNKIFIFLSLNYYINKMISLLPTINKSNLLHLNFFLNCNLCNLTSTLQLFLVFKVFTNFPAPLLLGYTCLRKLKIKNFMGYPRFLLIKIRCLLVPSLIARLIWFLQAYFLACMASISSWRPTSMCPPGPYLAFLHRPLSLGVLKD